MTTQARLDSIATIPADYQHLCTVEPLPHKNGAAGILPDIATLGLSVSVPANCQDDYLDWLCKELDLYSALAGNHHKIQQIWLQGEGLRALPPAQLTQLVYCVGSQFQLADGKNSQYGIEICHTQINPQRLALLRGLGFKQLRIHFGACHCLSYGDWISEVAGNIELLGNYDFEEIYCRVHLGDFAQHNDIKKLLLSLHLYQPQQIELTGIRCDSAPSQTSRTFYLGLMELLTQRGYQILGNSLFISGDSQLKHLQQQQRLAFSPQGFGCSQITGWFGAGLGATGYINDKYHENSQDPEQYQQLLAAGSLPRNRTGLLPGQQQGIQTIVQPLFCHGELNGRQVEQLPTEQRLLVESVITEAAEKLWLEPAGCLWQLTPYGRIHLRQLFSHLLKP